MDRRQTIRERLEPIEVGPLHRRVAPPVVVGGGLELVEHRGHEGGMVDELRLQFRKRLQDRDRQLAVDRQRPEAGRVRRVEIGGDESLEALVIGTRKAGKELAAGDRIERRTAEGLVAEPVERRVLVSVERPRGLRLRPRCERRR